jgi:hypothetical protein
VRRRIEFTAAVSVAVVVVLGLGVQIADLDLRWTLGGPLIVTVVVGTYLIARRLIPPA